MKRKEWQHVDASWLVGLCSWQLHLMGIPIGAADKASAPVLAFNLKRWMSEIRIVSANNDGFQCHDKKRSLCGRPAN
jgi:hypothetical protein